LMRVLPGVVPDMRSEAIRPSSMPTFPNFTES
jgi:hypothetical protein